jgi:nucleotide-binding universal stress UspA family protein
MRTSDGIVVGYDGSPDSEQAMRWAVREAKARGTTLTACLAWLPSQRGGEEILARALRPAEAQLGSGRVRKVVVHGKATQVLRELSATAEMVVVGARGQDALDDMLLGSVPWRLAGHGYGPIVVVRGPWRSANHSPGLVMIGVDGSAASRIAIPFAFEEAALRGEPLLAMCAVMDAPASFGGSAQLEDEFADAMTEQEKEHPDVIVLRQLEPGSPRHALLTAASNAQLLVIGAHGRGGVAGMSLGSVAHAVLHHAPCPVAIVRPRRHDVTG